MSRVIVRKPNFFNSSRLSTLKKETDETDNSDDSIEYIHNLGQASINFNIERKFGDKRLPQIFKQSGLRFTYLNLDIGPVGLSPVKFLRNLEDRQFIEFSCGFRFEVIRSIERFVEFITSLHVKWFEDKRYGQEIIGFIISESSKFIIGYDEQFNKDLLEGYLVTLYSDYEIIENVNTLIKILKGGKFKNFKRGISDSMISCFNLFVSPSEQFERDLIGRYLTLWIFALLNIN